MAQQDWLQHIQDALHDPDAPAEGRRNTLEGLAALARGELKEATAAFRRAQRRDEAPFDAVAAVALAECLRVEGREGAALKTWHQVIDEPKTPDVARYAAWLGLANLYARREDDAGLQRAQDALASLAHVAR